jgi:hypothetical protein
MITWDIEDWSRRASSFDIYGECVVRQVGLLLLKLLLHQKKGNIASIIGGVFII